MPMPIHGVATGEGEGPRGRTGGTAGSCQRTALSISLHTAFPSGAQGPLRMKRPNCLFWNLTWGPHQSWDQMSITSSRNQPATQEKTAEAIPPQNPQKRTTWVTWRGWVLDMPSCWQELAEITEIDDFWELAQKMQASFEFPQQMSKLHDIENYYLAPLAPKCLHQKDFLLLPDQKFPCWDIREEQLKKTVAYAQTLQSWLEKSNPSTPHQPCLLAGSILELREVMELYVIFCNDTIFGSVAH